MTEHERPWTPGGVALAEHRTTLPADSSSPRAARRMLRAVMESTQHDGWRDAAELALSEVVTNAVLHAHTPMDVLIVAYDDRVCVQVGDANPLLPVWRSLDAQASTGRGLGLVAAVALECGIESRGRAGKIIWFTIGDSGRSSDGGAPWRLDEQEDHPAAAASVVLRRMPATLWLSAKQHHDALLRELALYAAEHEVAVDFAQVDWARHRISDAVLRAVDQAHARGDTHPAVPSGHPSPMPWVPEDLDLPLGIDPSAAEAFLALPDALDVAERLAVTGDLLVLPGLPEIIAVRDWACEQVVAQLAGSPAAPWPGTAQERFETESHGRATPDDSQWDTASVRDATRGVVAADDANRIVAISRPLAAALGWDPDDLVGRRVVTLIPPSLREAHVAGFSRHLSTGEANVIGVRLELPVLHADGHEILCDFLIERTAAGPGRTIYRAWIEPKSTADPEAA